jgi:hypothetical protein
MRFISEGFLIHFMIVLPNYLIAITASLYRWIPLPYNPNDKKNNNNLDERLHKTTERFSFLTGMLLVQITLTFIVISYLPTMSTIPLIVW